MTIAFTRLFTTQGLNAGALNETNTYRGTTLVSRQNTLVTQLATSAVYGTLVSGVYTNRETADSAENGYVGALQTLALDALLADIDADRPGTGSDKATAVKELRRQMLIAGETLNDCPGAVAVSIIASTGDHNFVFGLYEPVTGKPTDFVVPDIYLVTLVADRSQGGTAFAETFSIVGKTADALPTDARYPSGTGIDTQESAVNPATDESIVSNGSFQSWTTNVPTDWTLGTGTVAGTHVFEKDNDDPRGTASTNKSARFLGDGAIVPKLRQQISVEANTAYTAQFRLKKVADPGTDWAVSLLLTDSAGTALAGNSSFVNTLTSGTAGSVAADWTNVVSGQFLLPAVLPTGGVFLEVRFHQFGAIGTAPVASAEAYVDHVSVQGTEPMYPGGPTLTIFSGRLEGVVGDARTATATITGVPSTYLIRGIDRLIGLASLGDRIPTVSGGGETQVDGLVV